jgi:hypothetical protein
MRLTVMRQTCRHTTCALTTEMLFGCFQALFTLRRADAQVQRIQGRDNRRRVRSTPHTSLNLRVYTAVSAYTHSRDCLRRCRGFLIACRLWLISCTMTWKHSSVPIACMRVCMVSIKNAHQLSVFRAGLSRAPT